MANLEAESVLVIDIGATQTRVSLFDTVEGQYRFIASGVAPSTLQAPFRDISEGVYRAIDHLQEITGRLVLNGDSQLLLPTQEDGSGVDHLFMTFSGEPEARIITAGLLNDVSLESAQRLATCTYGKIVESISLTDHRRTEVKIDAILRANPDLIILTGGTEKGANRSVLQLAQLILLVCRLLPIDKRPEILYAGNQSLAEKIKEAAERWTRVHVAPNIRPSIDVENLSAAEEALNNSLLRLRARQISGFDHFSQLCSAPPMPSASAFGRVIRFLSRVYDPAKGVLGVDVGASHSVVAAALAGDLSLHIFPWGLGKNMPAVLDYASEQDVQRWLPLEIAPNIIRDYLWQKQLYPASLPLSAETLAIEEAVLRVLLRSAMRQAAQHLPWEMPLFEPILAAGAVLTQTGHPGRSLLALLDGLQPVGVTTFILDPNHLATSLGVVANTIPLLPVQVMESGAFLNLGTVISPVSGVRSGNPALKVRLEREDGAVSEVEVRSGRLATLPLAPGQTGRVHLEPLQRTEIDPLHRRQARDFKVVGGLCSVVIDARGRPLRLPANVNQRRELLNQWNESLNV